jgi:hypothetical protein
MRRSSGGRAAMRRSSGGRAEELHPIVLQRRNEGERKKREDRRGVLVFFQQL